MIKVRFGLLGAVVASLSLFALSGCSGCSGRDEEGCRRPSREDFIQYNRGLFWRDSICISQYSDTLGLNPKPTATNLWLTIHQQGEGERIKDGDVVSFDYVVTTLLGDTIYTSAQDGRMTITVGKFNVCEGVDEAMVSLRRGAYATAILIPEKAFGVKGDDKKIHGRVILRYDLKIINP